VLRRLDVAWGVLVAAGAALAAIAFVAVAYKFGPLPAAGLVGAAGVAAVALRWPHLGLAGAFLATPLELYHFDLPGAGSLTPTLAILVVLALGWIARVIARPDEVVRPTLRDWAIIGLLVVMFAGISISPVPAVSARVVVLWTLFYLVYLQVQSFTPEQMRLVLVAFAIGAGILGVIGTVDYFTSGNDVVYSGGLATGARAIGAFGDANYYASLLALAIVPAVALCLRNARRYGWLIIPAAVAISGIVFSLSRGGVLGLGAGLILLLLWGRARWVALGLAVVVAVLAVAGIGPKIGSDAGVAVTERLSTINASTLSSTNPRPRIWGVAIDAAETHPILGVGTQGFQHVAADHQLTEDGDPLENVHNQFLGFAAENGLTGALLFLVIVVQWLVRGVRALSTSEKVAYVVALGLLAGLGGFLVQALTLQQLRVNVIAATFFVFGAMLTALADRARRVPEA
jgi:O-antigen ligase